MRDWSDDAVTLVFAITITLAAALACYLTMPP